jgi:hypothetical protein
MAISVYSCLERYDILAQGVVLFVAPREYPLSLLHCQFGLQPANIFFFFLTDTMFC